MTSPDPRVAGIPIESIYYQKFSEESMFQTKFRQGQVQDGFKRVAGSPKRRLLYQACAGTRPGPRSAGGEAKRSPTFVFERVPGDGLNVDRINRQPAGRRQPARQSNLEMKRD